MTFTVYAANVEDVSKRLDRLASKASRYNVPFGYSVGEEHPQIINIYDLDPATSTKFVVDRKVVAAVDFEVECEELIKAKGWTVRAKIEHGENGNIVTGFGFSKPDPTWYTLPSKCDHCGTTRARKVTFLCENDQGEIKQVGRACLKDYTGINPATALLWAEVRDLFCIDLDCSMIDWTDRKPAQMYDVRNVLAHAYDEIKREGYRKSDCPGSTRENVLELVLNGKAPSAEGLDAAYQITHWLAGLDEVARCEDAARAAAWAKGEETMEEAAWAAYRALPDTVGDLERNCIPLALSGYTLAKHFGRLAYMPVAYEKFQEREAKRKAREAEQQALAAGSKHVGEVGQRITIKMASAKLLSSWDNAYGTTYLYKFVDESGNVYIWYASRCVDLDEQPTIKATIKDHNERDGVKQTVLTRCKAA